MRERRHPVKLSAEAMACLVCPTCRGPLSAADDALRCVGCAVVFPIIDGVPLLLGGYAGMFSADGTGPDGGYVFARPRTPLQATLHYLLPAGATNLYAEQALTTMAGWLGRMQGRPKVLVIGAGESGSGISVLSELSGIDLVQSDVVRRSNVSVVLDAHEIPFDDATFDAVVAQAVLEHVLDPVRCVAEIWRVLRSDGLVYAETPFMQQVHGGRYDFTRFTFLGHRRLLRSFEELESGIVAGPGTALAWAWEYFLMSFCRTMSSRSAVRVLGRLTSFHLKYFDRYLRTRPGAYDAASAYGFLGRKSPLGQEYPDDELIASYPGLIP